MKGFSYQLREGLSSVLRNRLVNTGAVGLLITSLVMTGAFAMFMANINRMVDEIGAVNEVSIFMDENAPDSTAESVKASVEALDNIASVTYVSKEDALESMRDDFGDLLDGLEEDNPLRDGFVVTLEDQELMEATVEALGQIKGVVKISYNGDVADKFVDVRNFIAMLGIGVIAVLAVVSVLIVTYSVRISAYTKREEIEIMKIVGATDGFVRAPFVIEGITLGLIGAALSYGAIAILNLISIVVGIIRFDVMRKKNDKDA